MAGYIRPRDKVVYKGTESFTVLQLSRTVTFPAPMANTDYDLYWNIPGALTANIALTTKTVNGFTITIGIGLAMTMTWVAVENVTT